MTRRKPSRGECAVCGHKTLSGKMAKHIVTCLKLQQQKTDAGNSERNVEYLYQMRMQATHSKDYWLDMEIRGSASLTDIDSYLRRIWLECCGHLSQFFPSGGRGNQIAESYTVDEVFQENAELLHIYDLGTSTHTKIMMVSKREGKPLSPKPMVLLARNLMPEAECWECDQPGTYLCKEMWDECGPSMVCDKHAASNKREKDYGKDSDEDVSNNSDEDSEDNSEEYFGKLVKLVNSPRLGFCGYCGPAKAPY